MPLAKDFVKEVIVKEKCTPIIRMVSNFIFQNRCLEYEIKHT